MHSFTDTGNEGDAHAQMCRPAVYRESVTVTCCLCCWNKTDYHERSHFSDTFYLAFS